MKKRCCDVIVEVAADTADHPFTYRIPPEYQAEITEGSVVRIPFGKGGRVIRGYVVAFRDRVDIPEESIKDIAGVETGAETSDARLIALAAWMCRTCGSTMLQAMKTVLPVKRRYGVKRDERVSVPDREKLAPLLEEASRRHWHAKERVLSIMEKTEDEIPLPELLKEASVPSAVVRGLVEKGVLSIRSRDSLRTVVKDVKTETPDIPNEEQKGILEAVRREWQTEDRPVLINGVTGSGKTVVYTELVSDVLKEGRQAIVLIPEIALTAQTVARFVKRFGDRVSFLHSRLSGGERYDQLKAASAGQISVMVGPRSALFTPFPSLGLIIVDEEHEESYHSENVPRYHARDAAVERGRLEHAHVVLGSATPSVVSAFRAERGEYLGLRLASRYSGSALPSVEIVDMRKELELGNRSVLSAALTDAMKEALDAGQQIILFLNRRGYSGAWTCRSCGQSVKCPHCDVSLTHHRDGRLICHYCGYEETAHETCPACGSPFIGGMSVGTEQVEELVERMFPGVSVLRMDADTTRGKDGFRPILEEFAAHRADVLIGTQMIVKGHDFPLVTLVGVLMADISLGEQDYRSSEHTYQILAQAVGRAGRGALPGRAVIQTYQPDHFAVRAAALQDYDAFYREEIRYREILSYPPRGAMTAVLGSAPDEERLTSAMRHLRAYLDRINRRGTLHVIGPAPQTVGKIRDHYRQVIYIRHENPDVLIKARQLLEEYVALNTGFRGILIQYDLF